MDRLQRDYHVDDGSVETWYGEASSGEQCGEVTGTTAAACPSFCRNEHHSYKDERDGNDGQG